MSRLAEYLNRHVVGNVFDRPSICENYATDRSILTYTPKMVAVPRTGEDICRLLRFINQLAARSLRIPVTLRGTGLDTTGASLGAGLIISTEKLNQIEEIDTRGRLVRLQPGITLGELNQALALHGLWLPIGADPKSTIGGLIANCPNDDYYNRYSGISHYVERVEVALSDGELVQLAPYTQHEAQQKAKEDTTEGKIYRKLLQVVDEQADVVLDRSMRPMDAEGYSGITTIREGHMINLLPLLYGSQGTLGAITDVILRLEPLPNHRKRLAVTFRDLKTAQRFLNFARDLDPYLLNIYDVRIINQALENGKKLKAFTHKMTRGVLVIIGFDFGKSKNKSKLKKCQKNIPENSQTLYETPENSEEFDNLEECLVNYLNNGNGEHTPVLDDVYVPSMNFGDFTDGLKELEETLGIDLPVYGSFATPNFKVRPDLDITDYSQRQQIIDFMQMYSELVLSCQGSIVTNHPEGRTRAIVQIATMSGVERRLYATIKDIFDPLNIMNPGVKLGSTSGEALRHVRTTEIPGITER